MVKKIDTIQIIDTNWIDHCLTKDDLGRKIMKEFLGLRKSPYNYLIDGRSVDKKAKKHKNEFHKNKTLILRL